MLLVCVTPPIKAGSADPKIPASFAGIADLLRVLKHLKFALNVAFFVRHEYFLHPKSGNLQEVSQETVHIYTSSENREVCGWDGRIRTYGTLYQKQLPYHLATSQRVGVISPECGGVQYLSGEK